VTARRSRLAAATALLCMVWAATASTALAAWSAPTVLDGSGGSNGRVSAPIGRATAAVQVNGVTHVFYAAYAANHGTLREATLSATPSFHTLDGAGGSAGRTTHSVGSDISAAVFGGVVHVFYRDDTAGDLRHAWFDGTSWRFQTLDGGSTTGGRISADLGQSPAAATYASHLDVFYLDTTHADVREASFDGSGWSFATIDGNTTAGGHTPHQVGFALRARVWAGALHVLYYEQDPAYGELLGWLREARYDGSGWTYQRDFRVNTIVAGKTLAIGVAGPSSVYVAYNTTFQADPRLRWRHWNGSGWSDSTLLTDELFGDVTADAVFAVVGGVPTLVFSDTSSDDTRLFTVSGGGFTEQFAPQIGHPTSAVVAGGVASVFWGGADPVNCCEQLLLRTTGP
jgi:hypothetical protein